MSLIFGSGGGVGLVSSGVGVGVDVLIGVATGGEF